MMRITILFRLASTVAALSADLISQASIIDGDTLEIHGTRVRLWGIDAPESDQLCRGADSLQYRCGTKAANDLDAFIASQSALHPMVPASKSKSFRAVVGFLVARQRS